MAALKGTRPPAAVEDGPKVAKKMTARVEGHDPLGALDESGFLPASRLLCAC